MTIAEMHTAINLGVQKVASFQVDTILIEEMDLEINKSIERFVNQRYNKFGNKYRTGFEESQKRIDDLRTLIMEDSNFTTYKGQISDKYHVDTYPLPVNVAKYEYRYLINARSLVLFDDCNPVEWEYVMTTNGILDPFSITLSSAGQDYYCPPSVVIDPPPGTGTQATAVAVLNGTGGIDQINMTNSGTGYTGSSTTLYNMSFANPPPVQVTSGGVNVNDGTNTILVTPPICSLLSPGMGIVPNNPGVVNVPSNTYITNVDCITVHLVGGGGNFRQITLNQNVQTIPAGQTELWDNFDFMGVPCIIDNVMAAATGLPETIQAGSTTIGIQLVATDERTISGDISTTSSVNKYVQLDDIYTLLEDPFNSTKHTKPLMTIRHNYLDLYTDDTFVVRKVKITYIKKPKTVIHDNATNGPVSCDLPLHTHEEIVSMTVNSILEGISDPRYQTNTVELIKSE